MSRKRSKPWLHRFSRPLIGAIATVGTINTAYITYLRFTSTSCPTDTCAVLASRYATVFGQPLSLFGMLAYIAMIVFALLPLLINAETQKNLRNRLEDKTWLLLWVGATAMFAFSIYLMSIMFTEFVFGGRSLGLAGVCPFCLFSAILATAMFVLVILGREWEERGTLISIGTVVTLFTFVASLAIYAPPPEVTAGGTVTDTQGRVIFSYDTESGDAETQLAEHLQSTGAVMFGSYRCPHCCDQKALFGQAASPKMPYTECTPGGKDANPEVCQQELLESEKISKQPAGFPTWKIDGKYLTGKQTLQTLASASNYDGPQDFKNASSTRCTAQ
ncbi:vitamin K epoxide reductase family protein [filamentous cyanobacterium LEGE 11480]|uniref:Vitamin K epoxide reductase family protein n=1 Tax=Romeriopsis navalis LEGE 11480 TaxID=2777977 RepID=A0A928VMS2_9CYAN|nr:vitamin K epoxide reductase family protein [Romeriopsis navalis]MBE9029546.1 vitamin K epoxide reductase family protein [Romeriopsis navalis LEGE 11480]